MKAPLTFNSAALTGHTIIIVLFYEIYARNWTS